MNCTPNHLHLSFKPGMVQLILDLPAGNAEANLTSTRLPSCSKDNFPWLEAKQARRFKLPTMGSTVKPKAGGLLVRKGNRFFLSDPKGMELCNQVLVSMFKWWNKIN